MINKYLKYSPKLFLHCDIATPICKLEANGCIRKIAAVCIIQINIDQRQLLCWNQWQILTTAARVSKLFFHGWQTAKVANHNNVLVLRCTSHAVEFIDIDSTSNAKCNHFRPPTALYDIFQPFSLHLQLWIACQYYRYWNNYTYPIGRAGHIRKWYDDMENDNDDRYCCCCCIIIITIIGSRPSDYYFRSVCLFVCLFVQSFSQPSSIRFGSNKDACYMSGSSCVP